MSLARLCFRHPYRPQTARWRLRRCDILRIIRGQKLADISSYARTCFRKKGVKIIKSCTPIIPIYTYDTISTLTKAHLAYEAGVYVNPVLPPACAEGEGLLRASCVATLTKPLVADVLLNDDAPMAD